MPSLEQLRKVALYCDEYLNESIEDSGILKSNYEETYENCTNCTHYTSERLCELDLIDKVLSSMAMELDLKS